MRVVYWGWIAGRESQIPLKKYCCKKYFCNKIFLKNIFGENIFRENICDKNIFDNNIFLEKDLTFPPCYPPPPYNSQPLLPLIWSWGGGRNELTDRTHTRIVSFIVLDRNLLQQFLVSPKVCCMLILYYCLRSIFENRKWKTLIYLPL